MRKSNKPQQRNAKPKHKPMSADQLSSVRGGVSFHPGPFYPEDIDPCS